MAESKAAESYNAFEALRNRFGETKKPLKSTRSLSRSKARDPRSNAPPLVPLVEEGDQTQEALFQGTHLYPWTTSPAKGKWKNSQWKSNHLNGPDYDSLETSSVASGSSAYSSKEDSLSPTHSSVTELSDVGSVDSSFFEYDVRRSKSYQSRTAALKATFEQLGPRDIPDDFVQHHTKAWNRVIGEWIFDGIPSHSASMDRNGMRPPSNEIRVPTPLSTPQFGSTENLLDSVSKTSLLSNDSDDCDEDVLLTPEPKYKLGIFVRSPQLLSPLMASTRPVTTSSADCDETPQNGLNNPDAASNSRSRQHQSEEIYKDEGKLPQEKPTRTGKPQAPTPKSSKWVEAYRKYKGMKEKDKQADLGQQSQGMPQCSAEEPSYSTVVERRAKLFGGTRRGIRRAQSFQVGPRNSPRTAKRNTYFVKDLSISFS